MIPTYDWTEPDIVTLVRRHHTPDEQILIISGDGNAQPSIICSLCRTSPWPCAILLDLRAWWEENECKRVAMREERSKK